MTKRKRHEHPPLTPPRTIWRRWIDKGVRFKEKIDYKENDHGTTEDGRDYVYHPTKGWRNLKANKGRFNLTRYLIENGRKP